MLPTYRYHRLKEQRLHGHTIIAIPDTWECEPQEGREWWCGDKALGTGLFYKAAFMPSSPGPDDALPSKAALGAEMLGRLRAFLDTVEIEGEPEYDMVDEDFQVTHVVIDHDEDGETIRTFRWYVLQLFDDGVADIRFTLAMNVARIDDPAHRELVDIFADQVRRLAGWVGGKDDDEDDDGPPRLKRQHFGDRVTIRIPEAWGCREEEKSWWCWDRRERPGKLCVFWDFAPTEGEVGKDELTEAMQQRVHRIIEGMAERTLPLLERAGDIRDDNFFLYFVEDEEDEEESEPQKHEGDGDPQDGGPLRLHSWHVLSMVDDGIVDATVIFMIPRSETDTEHYRALVDLFAETVPAAELR